MPLLTCPASGRARSPILLFNEVSTATMAHVVWACLPPSKAMLLATSTPSTQR
nr:MAG TPA: hypothetical protein [Caudoviricetes sp.]